MATRKRITGAIVAASLLAFAPTKASEESQTMLAMTAMKFAAPHQLLFDKPVEKNYCQPESVSKTDPLNPCRVVELDLGASPQTFSTLPI
jgi:hypothetical protein